MIFFSIIIVFLAWNGSPVSGLLAALGLLVSLFEYLHERFEK